MTLNPNPRDSFPDAAGIRRTETRVWFDELPHTADRNERGWQVSWLADRDNLTLDQAHNALLIAKLCNTHRVPAMARRDWPAIRRLAHGLGVSARDAVDQIRGIEQREHDQAIATPIEQLPHLAIHVPARPELGEKVIRVDRPAAPTVRTPGRVPGQWLLSGEFLDQGVQR
ncbi:hypothetical protein AB0C65_32855 [Nocardia sp. NPDC048505]|uniref:hypothetical protein n=1 Tax=Nocardia sp. NPDC048505 TaxID=3155756 RepID=UPI0033CBD212